MIFLLKIKGFSGFNISLSFIIYSFSFCFFFQDPQIICLQGIGYYLFVLLGLQKVLLLY
jgi:hypothetical protein